MKKINPQSAKRASESEIPPDLRKVLASNRVAHVQWDDLTPIARRDFVSWIESAKQPETRKRRVESVPSRLASGKRRPCCYAIVPMNLYKTLNAVPKAKAVWKDLSPDERRDFVDWIEAVKQPERATRIEQVVVKLATGKRRP